MDTIIRDYAYPSEDERFNGIYPSLELEANNSEDIELVEDDGTQSDDDDDEPNWEWQWNYKAQKKENNKDKSVPKPVEFEKFVCTALPQLYDALANTGNLNKISGLKCYRTIFPFVKGTECEMSLESADEIIVLETIEPEKSGDSSKTDQNVRWSSIDSNGINTQRRSLQLTLDPSAEVYVKEMQQFLNYNNNYGDGWVTAIKIKVYGSWEKDTAKFILKDIGLIPANYIELIEMQDANK